MAAQIPRRETARGKLTLSVPGRDQQHQPIDLAALDALKLRGNLLVNSRRLIAQVGVLGEANSACLCCPPASLRGQHLLEPEQRVRR
jgi:hypothetical protein